MAIGRFAASLAIAMVAACNRPPSSPAPQSTPTPSLPSRTEGPAADPMAEKQDASSPELLDGGLAESSAPRVARSAVVRTGWPCLGCITRVPATDDVSRAKPLLILLHGNDGNTHWMDRIWHDSIGRHGMIAMVLRCPGAGGYGDPSWWRWHEGRQHEPGWLRARIAEVAREFPIDMARVYATGYSGGASYLSAYAASDPGLFAAVSLVAGGVAPRGCPSRAVPAHILVGSVDTMLASNVVPFRDAWTQCGGEVVWDERAGVTHEGILWHVERGGAEAIVRWLLGKVEARPAAD